MPCHTELLSPLEVGLSRWCQVRAKMVMPWNKRIYKPLNRRVFTDTQILDECPFGPHHVQLVQKDPPIQAQQSKGQFAVLKPRQAQCINSITGKSVELTHLKGDWTLLKRPGLAGVPGQTYRRFNQEPFYLAGWPVPISAHELILPFCLLILGLDNIFLWQNLLWPKAAACWSTHKSKHTWKLKLTLPTLCIPPEDTGKHRYR